MTADRYLGIALQIRYVLWPSWKGDWLDSADLCWTLRDTCAEAFEKSARFDDCLILDPGGDDMIAPVATAKNALLRAKLIVSLAPLVKTTSSSWRPRNPAT